jgi:hypothetical protein
MVQERGGRFDSNDRNFGSPSGVSRPFSAEARAQPKFQASRPAVDLDLIHYDGGIWWPFWTWHEDFGLGDEFDLDQFLRFLAESYDICQFLPAHGPPWPTIRDALRSRARFVGTTRAVTSPPPPSGFERIF